MADPRLDGYYVKTPSGATVSVGDVFDTYEDYERAYRDAEKSVAEKYGYATFDAFEQAVRNGEISTEVGGEFEQDFIDRFWGNTPMSSLEDEESTTTVAGYGSSAAGGGKKSTSTESVIDTILGEAKAGDFDDMLSIASVISNRADKLGVSVDDVLDPSQFNAVGKALPAGVDKYRDLAEKAWGQVVTTGPVTEATYYATEDATKNLPSGLEEVDETDGHKYFVDPLDRSIKTALGYIAPTLASFELPETTTIAPSYRPDDYAYAPSTTQAAASAAYDDLGLLGFPPSAANPLTSKTENPVYDTTQMHQGLMRDDPTKSIGDTLQAYDSAMGTFTATTGKEAPVIDALSKSDTGRGKKGSGYYNPGSEHFAGRALDISVKGMTDTEKQALVGSLFQAGFKGFGFGATSIHADLGVNRTPDAKGLKSGRSNDHAVWDYGITSFAGIPISDWTSALQGRDARGFRNGQYATLPDAVIDTLNALGNPGIATPTARADAFDEAATEESQAPTGTPGNMQAEGYGLAGTPAATTDLSQAVAEALGGFDTWAGEGFTGTAAEAETTAPVGTPGNMQAEGYGLAGTPRAEEPAVVAPMAGYAKPGLFTFDMPDLATVPQEDVGPYAATTNLPTDVDGRLQSQSQYDARRQGIAVPETAPRDDALAGIPMSSIATAYDYMNNGLASLAREAQQMPSEFDSYMNDPSASGKMARDAQTMDEQEAAIDYTPYSGLFSNFDSTTGLPSSIATASQAMATPATMPSETGYGIAGTASKAAQTETVDYDPYAGLFSNFDAKTGLPSTTVSAANATGTGTATSDTAQSEASNTVDFSAIDYTPYAGLFSNFDESTGLPSAAATADKVSATGYGTAQPDYTSAVASYDIAPMVDAVVESIAPEKTVTQTTDIAYDPTTAAAQDYANYGLNTAQPIDTVPFDQFVESYDLTKPTTQVTIAPEETATQIQPKGVEPQKVEVTTEFAKAPEVGDIITGKESFPQGTVIQANGLPDGTFQVTSVGNPKVDPSIFPPADSLFGKAFTGLFGNFGAPRGKMGMLGSIFDGLGSMASPANRPSTGGMSYGEALAASRAGQDMGINVTNGIASWGSNGALSQGAKDAGWVSNNPESFYGGYGVGNDPTPT